MTPMKNPMNVSETTSIGMAKESSSSSKVTYLLYYSIEKPALARITDDTKSNTLPVFIFIINYIYLTHR